MQVIIDILILVVQRFFLDKLLCRFLSTLGTVFIGPFAFLFGRFLEKQIVVLLCQLIRFLFLIPNAKLN